MLSCVSSVDPSNVVDSLDRQCGSLTDLRAHQPQRRKILKGFEYLNQVVPAETIPHPA
jgi:hypothetical protein